MKRGGHETLTFSSRAWKSGGHRGQVTIFIILGIVIVGGVSLAILVLSGKLPSIGKSASQNPESFLASCLADTLKNGLQTLGLQGGYVSNPLNISYKLTNEKNPVDISYLCYSQMDGQFCVNQDPSLIKTFESQMEIYSKTDVKNCFDSLITNLKKQGYGVTSNYNNFSIKLDSGKLSLTIFADVTVSKGEVSSRYTNFTIQASTQMYNMLRVAQEIVNKEATTCDFSQDPYSYPNIFDYPDFNINKYYNSLDSSKIYSIKDDKTNEEFRFATRGCVFPPL